MLLGLDAAVGQHAKGWSVLLECPLGVRSELQRQAHSESAAGGRADETRRKRTNDRRSSGVGGIAVVAGGEPDSLLLATFRLSGAAAKPIGLEVRYSSLATRNPIPL